MAMEKRWMLKALVGLMVVGCTSPTRLPSMETGTPVGPSAVTPTVEQTPLAPATVTPVRTAAATPTAEPTPSPPPPATVTPTPSPSRAAPTATRRSVP